MSTRPALRESGPCVCWERREYADCGLSQSPEGSSQLQVRRSCASRLAWQLAQSVTRWDAASIPSSRRRRPPRPWRRSGRARRSPARSGCHPPMTARRERCGWRAVGGRNPVGRVAYPAGRTCVGHGDLSSPCALIMAAASSAIDRRGNRWFSIRLSVAPYRIVTTYGRPGLRGSSYTSETVTARA